MCGSGAMGFDPEHKAVVQGRLELKWKGKWHRVCADNFTGLEAEVACRQLGHTTGKIITSESPKEYFQEGCQLDTLSIQGCSGSENDLTKCTIKKADCTSPNGDIGIKCYWNHQRINTNRPIRLMTA